MRKNVFYFFYRKTEDVTVHIIPKNKLTRDWTEQSVNTLDMTMNILDATSENEKIKTIIVVNDWACQHLEFFRYLFPNCTTLKLRLFDAEPRNVTALRSFLQANSAALSTLYLNVAIAESAMNVTVILNDSWKVSSKDAAYTIEYNRENAEDSLIFSSKTDYDLDLKKLFARLLNKLTLRYIDKTLKVKSNFSF